jgi:formamidopyrimidine-DNA glycosylase
MLEIPEAAVIASQLDIRLRGRKIRRIIAASSPHKFAWFTSDPKHYEEELLWKEVISVKPVCGMIEIDFDGAGLVFSDGVNLRLSEQGEKLPNKHQLLLEFDDAAVLTASVLMYGGISLFSDNTYDNVYYLNSRLKPSPLSDAFDRSYFEGLFKKVSGNLSLKAFLATEQRIPGLGNGTLQDILFEAGMHPKKKVGTLTDNDKGVLYKALKGTLAMMYKQGGRDVETDALGKAGRYVTKMGKNTVGNHCLRCGNGMITKESYMGGSIYYCDSCQSR